MDAAVQPRLGGIQRTYSHSLLDTPSPVHPGKLNLPGHNAQKVRKVSAAAAPAPSQARRSRPWRRQLSIAEKSRATNCCPRVELVGPLILRLSTIQFFVRYVVRRFLALLTGSVYEQRRRALCNRAYFLHTLIYDLVNQTIFLLVVGMQDIT